MMMLDKTHCPICNAELAEYQPNKKECTIYDCIGLTEQGIELTQPHYRLRLSDGDLTERIIIYPYRIDSYQNETSDIYRCSGVGSHFIIETTYLDLPWHDKEKVIQKLKLYTLIS